MFYTFSYTPDADDEEATPHELEMRLSAGVIHQVDVLFQDGCLHQEFVRIRQAGYQVWPTNRQGKLRGNATVISFREFFEIEPGETVLTAHIWTTLGAASKEIAIQIGVLPKRIIQPISFEELLTAAVEAI